ncbi:MAG: T9SS type A sorting domain-containing protein [Bacteroidales bacterium]|nr:T9SS type A sorting domain-containing protein [Bacteroidales bacterium]
MKNKHNHFKEKLQNEIFQKSFNGQMQAQNFSQQAQIQDSTYGDSPGFDWAEQFGGSGEDHITAITSDDEGNIYLAGHFTDQITIDNNTYESPAKKEAFVAKFNNAGDYLWIFRMEVSENEETHINDLERDSEGNLYVTGYYTGEVNLGSTTFPDVNEYSAFYARIDHEGNVIGGNYHSLDQNEAGLFLAVDDNSNVYITVSRSNTLDSRHESWILRYDPSDNLVWEQQHDEGFNGIIIHNSSLYFTGVILNSNDGELNNGITIPIPIGYNDVFLAKASFDGNFEWVISASHDEWGDSMEAYFEMDGTGNFYMTGSFRVDLMFNEHMIQTNPGQTGQFLAKFNGDGVCEWLVEYEDYSSGQVQLYADDGGNMVVTHHNMISMYNAQGVELWAKETEKAIDVPHITVDSKIITARNKAGLMFLTQSDGEMNDEWMLDFGGTSASAYVAGSVSSEEGDLYTYSNITNTQEFFDETVESGAYISKTNADGDLIWINHLTGAQVSYALGNKIILDKAEEYVFITGRFTDELIIPGQDNLTADGESVFGIKYNVDGDFEWAINEPITSKRLSVGADYSGNVFLIGNYNENIEISGVELQNIGHQDIFIAKYSDNGSLLWAKAIGGPEWEYGALIDFSPDDHIYFTGEFISENVSFDGEDIVMEEGEGNTLMVKMSPDGDIVWYKKQAGSTIFTNDYASWPTGILVDEEGYAYMKGWHGDSTYFDNILLRSPYGFGYSYYIAKFNPDGDALWAKSINQHVYAFDYNQFDIDPQGNVYFGAQTRDSLHFGDDFLYACSGAYDLFVARYSTEGELNWVKTYQGDDQGYNWISSVMAPDTSSLYVSGFFEGSLTTGNTTLPSTNRHGFILHYADNTTGVSEIYNSHDDALELYPNPTRDQFSVTWDAKGNNLARIEILTLQGTMMKEIKQYSKRSAINLGDIPKGIYIVKVIKGQVTRSEKLIVE